MNNPTYKKLMYAVLVGDALIPAIVPAAFVPCMAVSLVVLAGLGIADLVKRLSN